MQQNYVMLYIKIKRITNAPTFTHLLTPGVGSKVKTFFLKEIMLHITLVEMEGRALCKHIFCLSPSSPGIGLKGQKKFTESSHGAYQIKEHHASICSILTHTLVWVQGQNIFSESSHVAYQINGNGA